MSDRALHAVCCSLEAIEHRQETAGAEVGPVKIECPESVCLSSRPILLKKCNLCYLCLSSGAVLHRSRGYSETIERVIEIPQCPMNDTVNEIGVGIVRVDGESPFRISQRLF